MYEAVAALLTFNASIYFATVNSPRRRGIEHPTIVPYETFEASDGWINLGVANDDLWRRFCTAMKSWSQCIAPPRPPRLRRLASGTRPVVGRFSLPAGAITVRSSARPDFAATTGQSVISDTFGERGTIDVVRT
jgi:crotonobetainyl-CoA:carnitine CoA-transferase CaiB-like acyl-CoA transferase